MTLLRSRPLRVAAGLLPLVACASVPAAEAEEQSRSPRSTVALTLENDVFTGSDNNYSNGLGLTYQSAEFREYEEGSFHRDWVEFWSFLPHIGDENCQVHAAWTLGQEIYTPDDLHAAPPAADDQPYAGVLFLDSTLYARTRKVTHAWNLRLGLVGPASMAEETQEAVHRAIGSAIPQGWGAQLENEALVNVDYTVGYELYAHELSDATQLRFVPMVGAALGNYFTGASVAAYTELGWHLPPSIGLLSIRRGVDPFVDVESGDLRPWSLSTYVGAGGFAVGHYLPLDGTLTRDGPSVDSEPFVGFVSVGLTLRLSEFTLSYLLTTFGDAFETQRENTDYGTLSLAWNF